MKNNFPSKFPNKKPNDRPLSLAMERMYELWGAHDNSGDEFFSNFRYSELSGFDYGEVDGLISRRDPSKILLINGKYYVWYTKRHTNNPPRGPKYATETVPSFDWDLAEIWYATSNDGFKWEEQGRCIQRPKKGKYGCRSNSTPDILAWGGRYFLYFQAYNEIIQGGDNCSVTLAEADSPDGPWHSLGAPVITPSETGAWDDACIHDPYPLIYKGLIWLFYKGQNNSKGENGYLIRAHGVATSDNPEGPFEKSVFNPISNSGHETCLWPYKEGIATLVSLDGPEKNTIQFAKDGLNYEIKSIIQVPPIAPGPFLPDAFADNGDGKGITWGLCHINPDSGSPMNKSILARFDCNLNIDVDRPFFNTNNLRFDKHTYFQSRVILPDDMKKKIIAESSIIDKETIK